MSFVIATALLGAIILDTKLILTESVTQASPAKAVLPETKIYSGKPATIHVEKLGLNVPVADGIYNKRDSSWSLSFTNAHYATVTPKLNSIAGNTFIYGHNTSKIFGNLVKLNTGDILSILTDKGDTFYYKLESFHEVQPSNTEALQPSLKPILTIQTCTGNWNEKRGMFTFNLVSINNKPNI